MVMAKDQLPEFTKGELSFGKIKKFQYEISLKDELKNGLTNEQALQGINVEIIDIRSLYPLDVETIAESVKKTGYCLVLNQAVETSCFGEHIANEINKMLNKI
jgi:pyruvate/2-oxoglutarate/acetoin dehydrogenase E1 component